MQEECPDLEKKDGQLEGRGRCSSRKPRMIICGREAQSRKTGADLIAGLIIKILAKEESL